MWITYKNLWTIIHGMSLGGLLLMAIAAILIGLLYQRPGWLTESGIQKNARILNAGMWLIFILTWLTVIIGTYIIYPWYRATPPPGADLVDFPRSYLLAHPKLSGLHNFGMEWKEHVAWLSPILVTAVAYIIIRYRESLAGRPLMIRAVIIVIAVALFSVLSAVVLGALINKAAPTS